MTERASVAAVSKSTGGPDPLIGRVINDRFKINALIARGGMGKVYRAEQAPLGRICAIKVLNPNYAGEHDPEFHKRFFLEASIASKLTHPNTVTIFDYGRTEDDIYYMAMEYLEGHTLHRAIREAGHFPEERAAHVARQNCRALREAHSLGVIHRDLKPANIFLVEHGDETDFVKVLDFGLVKNVSGDGKGEDLTQTGLFMGSPKYMAPEQIRGDKVDARTDIYALGIIMYEMITGKVPFDRPNSVNILMAHVNEDAPPLKVMNPNVNVSPSFEDSIARCIAKDPDQRFRSMDEVLAALKRVGGGTLTATISGVGTGEYRSLSGSGSGPQVTANGAVSGANPAFLSPTGSDPGSIPSPLAVPSDSPAAGAPLMSQPPGKYGSKGMLVAAVVGALAIAAIIGFVALKPTKTTLVTTGSSPTATTAVTPTGTAAETATQAAPPPTVAAPSLVKVRINSEPDGASVKEDGVELCSSTPCDILYKGADADPAKEHKLTVVRNGYRNETKAVKVGDSPVTIKLTPAPVGPYIRPQPQNREPPPVPTGYKNDIPY
ncbi:MAG: protein kinase domain-containing protein [Polyangiaceae bacterium]